MTFIEKLKKLYQDNIWKAEKRKRDHEEAVSKEIRRAVNYFVKEAKKSAKAGHSQFEVHRFNMIYGEDMLREIRKILTSEYGLVLSWKTNWICLEGWA
jgi:hypothetical protein